jgi:predicted secreted Zn-dependent protease
VKKSNISLLALTVLLFICTLFTSAYGQVITNFSPTTTSAGSGSQITINGSGFGIGPASTTNYVEFAKADDGGQTSVKPALVEYISWADDKVVVIVPYGAGTGAIKVFNGTSTGVSSSRLTVSYSVINYSTYQLKHINDNTQGGYTWQLELGFNGQSNAKNSFLKSISAWTCFTGINWKIGTPTAVNETGRDGINVVRFDTGAELPAGVLGVAYTWYSSCSSGTKWQIIETDMVFDKERTWNFEDALPGPSEMDFQSVVQHELGHAHNLGHVIDNNDLMHYGISSGARRTIGQNNRDGGALQVAFSVAGGACSGAMTSVIPPTCASPYPKITGFSPTQAGTGTTVSITGENLSLASSVTFGGTPAASFALVSANQVDAILAAGASGEIAITTPGGTAYFNGFVYVPPPVINSFLPNFGFTGDTITISGANLNTTNLIRFGGIAAASFIVVNDQTVKAVVAAGASGKVLVRTTGGTVESNGFAFGPKPSISSFTPSGKLGDIIVINGSNFNQIQSVKFGGIDAASYTVNSDQKISAVLGVGSTGIVTVTSTYGIATKEGFVYFSAPTITSFNPQVAAQGTTVRITGTNFTGATQVLFGGIVQSSFVVNSATEISVVVSNAANGTVSVTTPGGTAVKEGFVYFLAPTITSFNPQVAAGGTTVRITGTNFTGATQVLFGGIVQSAFVVNSATEISVVVSNAANGTVSVTTPGGTAFLNGFVYVPPPVINSFLPNFGFTGDTITISGTNLNTTNLISFGGIAAASFIVVNDQTVKAVVAAGASGKVLVRTIAGTVESNGFTFGPKPSISSFTPSGKLGDIIVINGSNFNQIQSVKFGGIDAASFTVNSDQKISAVLGVGSTGIVTVTSTYGIATKEGFVYFSAPTITSFNPQAAAQGTTVRITGTNFTGATQVLFGGIAQSSFVVNSATEISVVVSNAANGTVSVTTPGGTAIKEGFVYFLAPTITSFNPQVAAGGTIVRITGTNFTGATQVLFGGKAQSSFVVNSATEISVVVSNAANGTVSVTTPGGTAVKDGFVYIPAPTITSFNPQVAAEGTTVRITGTNFTGATQVLFGGKAQSAFVVNSATEISVVVSNAANGTVSVTAPGGTAVKDGFVYFLAPTITSFNPQVAAEGTTVRITGTNFTGATQVLFGGKAQSSFVVNSATEISVVVSNAANGTVSVTTPGGTAVKEGFTYIMVPRVYSFTPANAGAGTTLTITGINFDQVTSVKFGSVEAASFKVLSAKTIEAVLAAGASGAVTVTNLGGTAELKGFTFISLPTISSIDPILGGKGTEINIYGTNFLTTQTVSIGNKVVTSFKVLSATHISAYVADGASDGMVVVSTLGGSSSFDGFRFILPPLISSFLPQNAIAGGSVLITGTNLGEVKGVSFGGKAATSFKIVSPTSISAVVASGSMSGNVVLTNLGGQAIKEGFTFLYTLPSNNFNISATGLSCRGTMNGIISVKTLQTLNYTATISGNGQNNRYDFSNSLEIKNLSPGVYEVCFTISTESTFKQCFEITVTQPKDLVLYSFINRADNKLNLKLEGSDTYFVELNGERIKTAFNEFQLSLKSGLNKVRVYTDKLCQGIIERSFFVDAVQIYPNPFDTELNLILGSEYSGTIKVEILNMGGKLIYSKNYQPDGGILKLNLDELVPGPYLLQISSGEHRTVRKIFRQ